MISRMRRSVAVLILALACLGQAVPLRAGSPLAPAIPFQAGFPRQDVNEVVFSSPAVVDLDGNGELDILVGDGTGCVRGWRSTGAPLPGFPWMTSGACSGTPRISGPLAIADLDGDGRLEVVAGTRGSGTGAARRGKVFVWHADGTLASGWPRSMAWSEGALDLPEIHTVVVGNIAGDGKLEVLAGTTNNSEISGGSIPNLYAWTRDGSLLAGFPQAYRTGGIYGQLGLADLNRDGIEELVVPRDQTYLHVYTKSLPRTGWPAQGYVDPRKTNFSLDRYTDFTFTAPAMGDLDHDGSIEIVAAGQVYDPLKSYQVTNSGLLVFGAGGKRRAGWNLARLSGPALSRRMLPKHAASLADLNGDGSLEIVVTLFDGTVRAYRHDGVQLWKHDYAQGKLLFASEPVIGDVSGDGALDIIFGTYSPNGSADSSAGIVALSAQGAPLPGFPLPASHERFTAPRGFRAAPTLADLDGDGDTEIIAGSRGGALYVWDLPAAYQPGLMPWPTGRRDLRRTGYLPR